MKNKICNFFLILLIGLCAYGCGLFRKAQNGSGNGHTVIGTPAMFGRTDTINARQLDSVCVVDGLSTDLEKWLKMGFYDYETRKVVDRYAFIKTMAENEEMTYILTPIDTLYILTKRYVKEVTEDE